MGIIGKVATLLMFLCAIIIGYLFLYVAIKGNPPKALAKYAHITK